MEGLVRYTCGCAIGAGGQQPGLQGMGPTCPTFLVLTEPGWGRAAWFLLPVDRTQPLPTPRWACLAQNPAPCFSVSHSKTSEAREGWGWSQVLLASVMDPGRLPALALVLDAGTATRPMLPAGGTGPGSGVRKVGTAGVRVGGEGAASHRALAPLSYPSGSRVPWGPQPLPSPFWEQLLLDTGEIGRAHV